MSHRLRRLGGDSNAFGGPPYPTSFFARGLTGAGVDFGGIFSAAKSDQSDANCHTSQGVI